MAVLSLRAAALHAAAFAMIASANAQEHDDGTRPEWLDEAPAEDDYSSGDPAATDDWSEPEAEPDGVGEPGAEAADGAEAAVDVCVAKVEDDRRHVQSIDRADPDRGGWRVTGVTSEIRGFVCSVDPQGAVEDLTYQDDGYYSGERG